MIYIYFFLGLETSVIPDEVDVKMIKVNFKNNNSVYEIMWEPVKNVNHGLVSYTVKVMEKEDKNIDSVVSYSLLRTVVFYYLRMFHFYVCSICRK